MRLTTLRQVMSGTIFDLNLNLYSSVCMSTDAVNLECDLTNCHRLLLLSELRLQASTEEGEDVGLLIPYVARNVSGLQDREPFRSILISGEKRRSAWTVPDVQGLGPGYPGQVLTARSNSWQRLWLRCKSLWLGERYRSRNQRLLTGA
jgi:hypothetical protein